MVISILQNSSSHSFPRLTRLGGGLPPVLRLGLATRGNTRLSRASVRQAVERGINYLNWCGYDDGVRRALPELDRSRVVLAMQLAARGGRQARHELHEALRTLKTDWIDVVTFYYVEHEHEWEEIRAPHGAWEAIEQCRGEGKVRLIGLTTHQRRLAAEVAKTGTLDLLMVRYNAAHRGAETEIFPLTSQLDMPVVCFTALRWGALLKPTRTDPQNFSPPLAAEWYRFALAHPAASVVLMAPGDHREMEENLGLLADWRPPHEEEFQRLAAHGKRVRKWAGTFW